MPKSIPVNPEDFRQPGRLSFPEIPLHAYSRSIAEEREARGDRQLVEALRHMMLLREFQPILASYNSNIN